MKKVRIMLSVILVFAIVGGTLAFRAKKVPQFKCFYSRNDAQTTSCPLVGAQPAFLGFAPTTDISQVNLRVGTLNPVIIAGQPTCTVTTTTCPTNSTLATEE